MSESGTVQRSSILRSVAEAAYYDLRESILLGKLEPGAPLLLKVQAERLGVSIMPVREAIKRLEHDGLVIHEPQRGAMVAPISPVEMEDIYRVRIALETLALREACKRITETSYRYLNGILDSCSREHERGNHREARNYHRSFHLELYRLAQSKTLDRLIPPLLDNCERYRSFSSGTQGFISERDVEHRVILDSCMRGKSEEAVGLLIEHFKKTIALVNTELNKKSL